MTADSYRALPYACRPIRWTHPDNLACKATLFGLTPANIEGCRVLEIGCGNGMNLFSLAQILPGSQFVGIDSSSTQIKQGRSFAQEIGCQQVELHALSVADWPSELGSFDYAICHGVYSWVHPSIADKILRVIKNCLTPNGIAYVSYNTYPGWHQRGAVREILRRQTNAHDSPLVRVQQARQYLDFLVSHTANTDRTYHQMLQREQEILARAPDAYLFHEHLEEVNEPVYFHQFAHRASQHGLRYLCEASFNPAEAAFSDELRSRLGRFENRIEYEQQVDFVTNAAFRKSLLCHSESSATDKPSSDALNRFYLRCSAKAGQSVADVRSPSVATFHGANQETLRVTQPLLKACLTVLTQAWPQALTTEEMMVLSHELLGQKVPGESIPNSARGLDDALLQCHQSGFIECSISKPPLVTVISSRPSAPRLARWQASHGHPVSNLLHELVELTEFDRRVITLLDGQHDASEIAARLGSEDSPSSQHALAACLKKLAIMHCLVPSC